MQIPGSLLNLTVKVIAESLDMNALAVVAGRIVHNYDFHRQTGFSENLTIPRQVAARQFVSDIKKAGLFLKLVEVLVHLHTAGHMGRSYPIKDLRRIISSLRELGIIYDKQNSIFVEDPSQRRTKNWGTLLEGGEYSFALLRLDIVGNSRLVRQYPEDVIQSTYADFRAMVQDAVGYRNGRIWSWEGDGGLVAFFFSNKNLYATFAGMDIVNRLYLYNMMQCRLDAPLGVRLAVHGGMFEYTDNEEDIKRIDVVKKVIDIESTYTPPNSLTVSNTVANHFCKSMLQQFSPVKGPGGTAYYNYSLRWEQ